MKHLTLSSEQIKQIQTIEMELLCEIHSICKKHDIKYTLAYGTMIGCIRHKGFIPWDDDVDICILRSDFEKFRKACVDELSDKYFYQTHGTDKEYYYLWDKIRVNNTVFKETFLGKYNIHHGIFIDIFPIDNVPNNDFLFNIQYFKFKFLKTGLMVKYVDIHARNLKGKIQAFFLKIAYLPFPLEFLYKHAILEQTRYNINDTNRALYYPGRYGKRALFPKEYYSNIVEKEFENKPLCISKYYDEMLGSLYGDYMKLPPKNKQNTVHDLLEFKIPCE